MKYSTQYLVLPTSYHVISRTMGQCRITLKFLHEILFSIKGIERRSHSKSTMLLVHLQEEERGERRVPAIDAEGLPGL